jgi:hypothetical protein
VGPELENRIGSLSLDSIRAVTIVLYAIKAVLPRIHSLIQ